MRRWLITGLVVLLALGLVPGIVAGDDQWDDHTWSQIVDLVNQSITASNGFTDQLNAASTMTSAIADRADAVANQLNQINQQITDLPPAPNTTVGDAITTFHAGITEYVGGLMEIRAAYETSDLTRWNDAIDEINRGIDSMNTAKESLRQELPESSKAKDQREIHQLIVTGTICFAILSLVLLVLGLRGGPYEADKAKAGVYLMMFKTSLIPTIGFLVTLGTYALAKSGGTYLIATGAVLFGGFRLFRQLWIYAAQVRPKLNDLGQAERLFAQQGDALWARFQLSSGPAFAEAVAHEFHVSTGAASIIAAQFATFQRASAPPATTDADDPYATLGVHPTDASDTIKARYRVLVKTHHPDTSGGDTAEAFIRIQRAYEAIQQERGEPV